MVATLMPVHFQKGFFARLSRLLFFSLLLFRRNSSRVHRLKYYAICQAAGPAWQANHAYANQYRMHELLRGRPESRPNLHRFAFLYPNASCAMMIFWIFEEPSTI